MKFNQATLYISVEVRKPIGAYYTVVWWESDATLASLQCFHTMDSDYNVDSLGPKFAS